MIRGKISGTDNKHFEFGEGKDGIMLEWSELFLILKIGNNNTIQHSAIRSLNFML